MTNLIIGRFARAEASFARHQSPQTRELEWVDAVKPIRSPAYIAQKFGEGAIGFVLGLTFLGFILGWN